MLPKERSVWARRVKEDFLEEADINNRTLRSSEDSELCALEHGWKQGKEQDLGKQAGGWPR